MTSMETEQDYSTWTSCEMYGHWYESTQREDGQVKHRCRDCGYVYDEKYVGTTF